MPIARPTTAATRLLLVVALAVLALLLAPVADVAGDVTATASAASTPTTGTSTSVHAEAVTAQRRAKKTRKTRRGTVAPAAPAAGASPWSTATLTYYDGLPSQWAWSLRTAAAQWNAAGVGITLRAVSDPAAAQVHVGYGEIGGSSGLATVGATAGAFVKLSDRYRAAVADQYDRVEVMGVLTHELGHVLGLEHVTTGCALMGPVMDIVGCGIYEMAEPDAYRCDLIGQAALAQASRLYGGTAGPLSAGACTVGS